MTRQAAHQGVRAPMTSRILITTLALSAGSSEAGLAFGCAGSCRAQVERGASESDCQMAERRRCACPRNTNDRPGQRRSEIFRIGIGLPLQLPIVAESAKAPAPRKVETVEPAGAFQGVVEPVADRPCSARIFRSDPAEDAGQEPTGINRHVWHSAQLFRFGDRERRVRGEAVEVWGIRCADRPTEGVVGDHKLCTSRHVPQGVTPVSAALFQP